MDSQGSETTKAETIRFSGNVYLGLKVCQSPLKFDFKLKMAQIEFFLIKFYGNTSKKNKKNMAKLPNFHENFAKIVKFEILANKYIKLREKV